MKTHSCLHRAFDITRETYEEWMQSELRKEKAYELNVGSNNDMFPHVTTVLDIDLYE